MKKFILLETGEEVHYGDTIRGIKTRETSFGNIEIIEDILVSRHNINNLISKGIIKYINIDKPKENKDTDIEVNNNNIGYYIKLLAIKYRKSSDEIIDWLGATNRIYPKAVLDLLLNEISLHFYHLDVEEFDKAENYYSLRPKDGKVGKVLNTNKYIPLFKSAEDAEKARRILKKQLELMYGE